MSSHLELKLEGSICWSLSTTFGGMLSPTTNQSRPLTGSKRLPLPLALLHFQPSHSSAPKTLPSSPTTLSATRNCSRTGGGSSSDGNVLDSPCDAEVLDRHNDDDIVLIYPRRDQPRVEIQEDGAEVESELPPPPDPLEVEFRDLLYSTSEGGKYDMIGDRMV